MRYRQSSGFDVIMARAEAREGGARALGHRCHRCPIRQHCAQFPTTVC